MQETTGTFEALKDPSTGLWKEPPPDVGHRANGEAWTGPPRGSSFPQPAEALPGHHTPTKPPPGQRYPNPNSSSGYPAFTALLYQDSEVRVFENRIVPGLLGPKHTHDDDYWLVLAHCEVGPSSAGITLQQSHEDPKQTWKLMATGPMQQGSVTLVKNGHTETADNTPESPLTIFYAIEIVGPSASADLPAGWGASAGVMYENTEVKIWDIRVPPGQTGSVPLMQSGLKQVFQVDIHGQRQGAMPMVDARKNGMRAVKNKYGTAYAFTPAEKPEGLLVVNDGSGPYRGVVLEVKDLAPAMTARL